MSPHQGPTGQKLAGPLFLRLGVVQPQTRKPAARFGWINRSTASSSPRLSARAAPAANDAAARRPDKASSRGGGRRAGRRLVANSDVAIRSQARHAGLRRAAVAAAGGAFFSGDAQAAPPAGQPLLPLLLLHTPPVPAPAPLLTTFSRTSRRERTLPTLQPVIEGPATPAPFKAPRTVAFHSPAASCPKPTARGRPANQRAPGRDPFDIHACCRTDDDRRPEGRPRID